MKSHHATMSGAACVLALMSSALADSITISFDVDAAGHPLIAPALFDEASPMTETYAPLGIHFKGPGVEQGGTILNDSTFTIDAHSGSNFLAFSAAEGGPFVTPETITFDSPKSAVSIFASGISQLRTFTMQAFAANGTLLDSDTIATAGWKQLSVASPAGIKSVVLTVANPGLNPYLFDDLVASTADAPACPADIDGSGTVDGADLGLLLGSWGSSGPADIDGSGTVDAADLGLLLGAWGLCP
ncbi:MAG: hypothetical protein U0572_03980 [Phycisphaerales bacterium]